MSSWTKASRQMTNMTVEQNKLLVLVLELRAQLQMMTELVEATVDVLEVTAPAVRAAVQSRWQERMVLVVQRAKAASEEAKKRDTGLVAVQGGETVAI